MILTCPNCATRYQTDSALLGEAGRKVRCAKCGHIWHQATPPAQAEREPELSSADIGASAASASADRPIYAPSSDTARLAGAQAKPQPKASRLTERLPLIAGWAGLALLVLAIGFSLIRFRQQIAELWPQSATLYRALGQDVYTRGLEFKDVSYREMAQDGQAVLAVTGKLVNITSHEVPVPAINVTLMDGDRRVLYHWSFSANVTTLKPGQAVSFVTRLTSPPSGARRLQLRLADANE
jgi:predicted Zn finger-like uncharacterized protein